KLAKFNIASFKDQIIEEIRREVDGREVICGVSGGVDSTVLAVLLHKAGVKQRCLFVDHGLLRKHEREDVVAQFAEVGVPIEVVDAQAKFLNALNGVPDPEEK